MEHPIDSLGGTSAVARLLEVSAPSVTNWRLRGIPVERCVQLEQLSNGAVKRWHMRPADWHRIWPELVGAEGAPAVPAADEVRHAA